MQIHVVPYTSYLTSLAVTYFYMKVYIKMTEHRIKFTCLLFFCGLGLGNHKLDA